MPEQKHTNVSLKAVCSGFALNVANDLQIKNKYNYLQNIRVIMEGVIQSRPKVDLLFNLNYAPDAPPVSADLPHSIKNIINKNGNLKNYIVGAGTHLFTGNANPLVKVDSGYSGKPLSIVDFRPEEATEAYAYIADELRLRKVSVSNILSEVGLNAPTKALAFRIARPVRKIIDNIKAADIGTWGNPTGSAGVPSITTIINTVITETLYDNAAAAPNFVSIIPNVFNDDMKVGRIVTINGIDCIIEEINPAVNLVGTCTIAKISYDVGSVGLCTIVLSTPSVDIARNSVLLLNAAEFVRVLEVTRDQNGIPSIRCSTVITKIAGQNVEGRPAFRVFAENTFSSGQTIFAEALACVIGAAGTSSITKTINIDLTNADNKPLSEDDFFHISYQTSVHSAVQEVQVLLDCNNGPQNFTDNFFQYVITQNFLTGSITQSNSTLATIQQAAQRRELLGKLSSLHYNDFEFYGGSVEDSGFTTLEQEIYNPVIQASSGDRQWTEIFIPLRAFVKVGSDTSRTKKDIKAIRISVQSTAGITFNIDSIYCGGGSTLSTERDITLAPYNYIWRVREPSTKVVSNWSPPLREGVRVSRGSIELTPIGAAANYPANHVIDIARWGGSLKDYRIIGTIQNNGTAFFDNVSDLTAALGQPASRRLVGDRIGSEEIFDFYKPFTFFDTPKAGTCSVVGTKMTVTAGDNLNVTYPRGSAILIDSKLNTFYTNPTSPTQVELEKDMGNLTGVKFEMKLPLLTGQPLPNLAGTFGEGNSGLFMFGWGNKKAAGTIYWLDGNSPDTQSDINYLEITSPSEPIVAGGVYDGFMFVFTSERSFYLIPTFESGGLGFIARENANSRGAYSSNTFCVGRDAIYFVTENADGICKVPGSGNPVSITDGSLYNLFIHDGTRPQSIVLSDGTIVYPPDFDRPNEIRLFNCGDIVVFRYRTKLADGNTDFAIIFDERLNDWVSYDHYVDGRINAFYQEEADTTSALIVGIQEGTQGAIGKFGGTSNREANIQSKVLSYSMDGGDSNVLKRFDEIVFDVDPGLNAANSGRGMDWRVIYDNGNKIEPPLSNPVPNNIPGIDSVIDPINRDKYIVGIGTEIENLARNIATSLSWYIPDGIKLYEQQFYFIPRSDEMTNRASDQIDGGNLLDKYWQGVTIEADTFGADKILKWLDDDGNLVATITINHDGKVTRSYSFPVPFISHKILRYSDDGVSWIFYEELYNFDLEPNIVIHWEMQYTTFGVEEYKVAKSIVVFYTSTEPDTVLDILVDDIVISTQILPNTGGVKGRHGFYLPAIKGFIYKLRLDAPNKARIYQKDLEFWIRKWNAVEDYRPIKPFGGKDYEVGAEI